jgi:Tfp pilus assembly PilM family ATPase/Tfp pilus assembly protein PilN
MHITLSISNNSIRVLAVKGNRAYKWGNADLKPGLVRDGLIMRPDMVGKAIGDLFKSIKVRREKVIVSISGLSFTYRLLNLPWLKPDAQEEAILRGFKREISLPPEELYLSWQPFTGDENEQTFFVVGVSRQLIDALVATLEAAGVEPYIMDIQPLALARAANRASCIIVSLERDCYDIVVIADGLLTVVHTISPRGEGATLEDNIQRLTGELTKTVTFYQSSNPNNRLPAAIPLLLTGELADDTATSALLQSMTEYKVEPLVPPLEIPSDIPVASYATNMGLALRKLTKIKPDKEETVPYHDVDINLLSAKLRKPKVPQTPLKSILLGVFVAIAIILLYPLYQSQVQLSDDNAFLESRLQRFSRELNLAGLVAAEAETTENMTQELTASLETTKEVQGDILSPRGIFTENFQAITGVLPQQLYLTSVETDKEIIIIEGEADSVFTVVDYATQLDNTGLFREVSITELDEDSLFSDETEIEETTEEAVLFIIFKITIIQ